jgi:uncharacterized protein with ATP-grasp and redox domains
MKSALDCIPCFVSQALKAARLATTSPELQEQILREILRRASEAELNDPPAWFGRGIYTCVQEITGHEDPYLAIKEQSNQLALEFMPLWRERLQAAENPREAAVKIAIAANVIDYGIKGDLVAEQIPAALESSFVSPLFGDVARFFAEADRSKDILFLADNAGELVFDRLLLELLPIEKITVVVKGGPAINDALMADARAAGLEGVVSLMDTGDEGAGVVLETCSPEFRRRFASAGLIIAKGQANFESLDGCEKNIFFLFKAKCPVVADHIGQPLGSLVLHHNVPGPAGRAAARGLPARPRDHVLSR